MRIALIGEGTRGDVAPLCRLGAELLARGHEVRLVSRPDFAETAPAGAEFRGIGPPIRRFTARHAGAFQKMGWAFARASGAYREECFRVQCQELPAALTGCDLAIGAGMVLGAPSVAEHLGIPYRLVLYCPALLPDPENAPAFFPRAGTSRAVNRALWAFILGPFDRWLRGPLNRERRRLGLAPVRRTMPHLLGERPVLCADVSLGPAPASWRDRSQPLPYLLPKTGATALPEKLEAFLDAGEAPLYLGFGSMPDPRAAETTRMVLEAVESTGRRALISQGWAGFGDTALPAWVELVGDVPHELLFPRVAAVVHHGGAGTTTSAARAGVPQLAMPHVLDQYYWGHRIHALGLGPAPLPRARLRPDRLGVALRGLLEAEWLFERAARFGETLRDEFSLGEGDFETLLG